MQYKDARIDGQYRTWLGRSTIPFDDWQSERRIVNFLMLNPSKANAEINDPTIGRVIGFATAWGFDTAYVTNLYAFRATRPADLWKARDPVGEDNDNEILINACLADQVICAWGANALLDRQLEVLALLDGINLYHLGLTKEGFPRHPLYLKGDTKPTLWKGTHDTSKASSGGQ